MDKIQLISPTKEFESQVMQYRKEFLECNESMAGASDLRRVKSFEAWLKAINDNLQDETLEEGSLVQRYWIDLD
ncbi:MAG: hypothetical protein GX046_06880 [Tissierellia bacterium]|nr:hypothetical protein [Tissierellia bacterium]